MLDFLLSQGPLLAYLGIAAFLALTGAGLPIPEEVFIIAAGVASAHGMLNPWFALVACLAGALAGDAVMYTIGHHFGRALLREHPWWARYVNADVEARMERMIDRHGLKVFFLARFLVGLRSPVYLTAGILRVPFRRFLLIDLVCASSVIGTFFGLSYFLSNRYGGAIYHWIRDAEMAVTIVVVLTLFVVCVVWWVRRRCRKQSTEIELPPESDDDDTDAFSDHPKEPVGEVEHVA